MKKTLVALALTSILCVGAAGCVTSNEKITTENFVCVSKISEINLDLDVVALNVEFYEGDFVELSYPTSSLRKVNVDENEEEGVLTYTSDTAVFSSITLQSFDHAKATLKLPKDNQIVITADLDSGTFNFTGGEVKELNLEIDACEGEMTNFGLKKLTIDSDACIISTSDLRAETYVVDADASTIENLFLSCTELKVEADASEFVADIADYIYNYTIKVEKSASSCNVLEQVSRHGKSINLKLNASSAEFSFADPDKRPVEDEEEDDSTNQEQTPEEKPEGNDDLIVNGRV